ncbi:hypothetical protein CYY_006688 [Polysphondylium violaceum]|uniref:Uncharacterized protein n=1 Tax=Polysphondylium violaceum TaxID=133409 RepID=A0A8J4V5K7_9MYCE|nr:hypothetical protein CYY_006688 [Polysphondylium violaceum]
MLSLIRSTRSILNQSRSPATLLRTFSTEGQRNEYQRHPPRPKYQKQDYKAGHINLKDKQRELGEKILAISENRHASDMMKHFDRLEMKQVMQNENIIVLLEKLFESEEGKIGAFQISNRLLANYVQQDTYGNPIMEKVFTLVVNKSIKNHDFVFKYLLSFAQYFQSFLGSALFTKVFNEILTNDANSEKLNHFVDTLAKQHLLKREVAFNMTLFSINFQDDYNFKNFYLLAKNNVGADGKMGFTSAEYNTLFTGLIKNKKPLLIKYILQDFYNASQGNTIKILPKIFHQAISLFWKKDRENFNQVYPILLEVLKLQKPEVIGKVMFFYLYGEKTKAMSAQDNTKPHMVRGMLAMFESLDEYYKKIIIQLITEGFLKTNRYDLALQWILVSRATFNIPYHKKALSNFVWFESNSPKDRKKGEEFWSKILNYYHQSVEKQASPFKIKEPEEITNIESFFEEMRHLGAMRADSVLSMPVIYSKQRASEKLLYQLIQQNQSGSQDHNIFNLLFAQFFSKYLIPSGTLLVDALVSIGNNPMYNSANIGLLVPEYYSALHLGNKDIAANIKDIKALISPKPTPVELNLIFNKLIFIGQKNLAFSLLSSMILEEKEIYQTTLERISDFILAGEFNSNGKLRETFTKVIKEHFAKQGANNNFIGGFNLLLKEMVINEHYHQAISFANQNIELINHYSITPLVRAYSQVYNKKNDSSIKYWLDLLFISQNLNLPNGIILNSMVKTFAQADNMYEFNIMLLNRNLVGDLNMDSLIMLLSQTQNLYKIKSLAAYIEVHPKIPYPEEIFKILEDMKNEGNAEIVDKISNSLSKSDDPSVFNYNNINLPKHYLSGEFHDSIKKVHPIPFELEQTILRKLIHPSLLD